MITGARACRRASRLGVAADFGGWWREREDRNHYASARIRDLESRVADWTKAKAILEFVDAVEAAAQERGEDTSPDSDLGRWLAWARERAGSLCTQAVGSGPRLQTKPS